MKKGVLSICTLIFLFACSKNNSNTPVIDKLVTSIWWSNSSDHTLTVDSLSYDNNKHIARIIKWDYDSTQNPILVDSTVWTFTYTGSANTPSSYSNNFYYGAFTNMNYTESHTLSYDNQGRVTFDTSMMVSTSGNTQRKSYFKYTAAYTVINQVAAYKDITDTIFMNNGNVAGFSAYAGSTGPGSFDYGFTYTYTNTLNPLYNSAISAGIGPLLLVRTDLDFISKKLPDVAINLVSNQDLSLGYITESSGLPTKGLAKDRDSRAIIGSVTYHYQ